MKAFMDGWPAMPDYYFDVMLVFPLLDALLNIFFAAMGIAIVNKPRKFHSMKRLGASGNRVDHDMHDSGPGQVNMQPSNDIDNNRTVDRRDNAGAARTSLDEVKTVTQAIHEVARDSAEPQLTLELTPAQSTPRIVINSRSVYEPKQRREPFDFDGKMPNPQNDDRRYLIVSGRSLRRLHESLDWGQRTKRNSVEQGGVLVGQVSKYKNEIYNFVQDVIVANTAGNPTFVEFTNSMWAEMQEELSVINDARPNGERLVITGWFHTHPGGLSVFMSGTDKATQRLNFSHEWQASLVMNPNTNTYRVFFGEKSTEGKVILSSSAVSRHLNRGGDR
jgi:proteasome lid subunit RPN8/RPN11